MWFLTDIVASFLGGVLGAVLVFGLWWFWMYLKDNWI
jgi:hypothetical protein